MKKGHQTKTKTHSRFSASASERWLNCPASITLSEKCPTPKESEAAKEGTLAHECLELMLLGKALDITDFPKEMRDYCWEAAEYILDLVGDDAKFLVETKCDLSFIHPEFGGTLDVAIVRLFDKLTVIDFKYGKGKVVEPENNTQMLAYALAIAQKYHFNFSEVEMIIVQPRAYHEAGGIRSWSCSMETLHEWGFRFADGVNAALEPHPEAKAGKWCDFCPAIRICPAMGETSLKEAAIDFNDGALVVPESKPILNPKKLGAMLSAFERVEAWMEAHRDAAFELAKAGTKIPGWKLVPKRSTRHWVNEKKAHQEACKKWGTDAIEPSVLKSPAQIEKLEGGKDWVKKRVSDVSSGFTLVHEDDKRAAVIPAALEFSDVSEGSEANESREKKTKSKKTKKFNNVRRNNVATNVVIKSKRKEEKK